jgi:hypothetical protein
MANTNRISSEMSKLFELQSKVASGLGSEQDIKTLERVATVAEVLKGLLLDPNMKKIGLVGGHCSAKSLISLLVTDRKVFSGDDYMHLGWGPDTKQVVEDLSKEETYFVEGVKLGNYIRGGAKFDALIVINHSLKSDAEMKPGQLSMSKNIKTVLKDCADKGLLQGVKVVSV